MLQVKNEEEEEVEGRKKNARSVREGEGDRERISQFAVIFLVVSSVTSSRDLKRQK